MMKTKQFYKMMKPFSKKVLLVLALFVTFNSPGQTNTSNFEKSDTDFKLLEQSAKQVEQYSLFELTFEADVTEDIAFISQLICVDAVFTSPSGKKIIVPGFYYQDYDREVIGIQEKLIPEGSPKWKIRFSPIEKGEYIYEITIKNKTEKRTSPKGKFTCIATNKNHGYIRVSQSDPHYFEFDNKNPYFPIGQNVCWYKSSNGTTDYDRWFVKMAENGANYARLWMPEWAFGLEVEKLGQYRMDKAWQLDYVLNLAEREGIYIKLCLSSWRRFEEGKKNPFWKEFGGPCETELDFFINEKPKEYFKNRIRYIIARWGYSTNIMAWELWNEFNTVKAYRTNAAELRDWTKEMVNYINSIDPYNHLTTTSLGSCDFDDALWHLPEMDWAQMHGYYYFNEAMKRDAKDMAYFIPLWQKKIQTFNKPAMFAEFGIAAEATDVFKRDTLGVNLHTGMWSSIMSGGCGTAMTWWWDIQVDPMNLYYHFKPISEFVRDIPWTTSGFMPEEPVCSEGLKCYMLEGPNLRLLWVYNTNFTWWNVVNGHEIKPVQNGQITVDMRMGQYNDTYTVEWWDTYKGDIAYSEDVKASNGNIILKLPILKNDIAAKIIRHK